MRYYTRDALRGDLVALNMKLGATGSFVQLDVEGRNGYTAVDITREVTSFPNGGCEMKVVHEGTLATGTPRECLNAINAFIVSQIS